MGILSNQQIKNRLKLINIAYKKQCTHIPSALSMLDYFYYIDKLIDYNRDALIIGKPYGQLAYHIVWNNNDVKIITGKTKKVLWADTTLGNCLGIANGIALSNKYRNVIINISDASLQEGTILEAAQFIGSYNNFKSQIILCVDCNNYQCISKNYQNINDIKKIFTAFNWNTYIIDGHNEEQLKKITFNFTKPTCLLFKTIKGYGVDFMENDPIIWHYKKIDITHFNLIKKQYETNN